MKFSALIKKPKFSLWVLIGFIVLFALGGIYFVYNSKASGITFWDEFNASPLSAANWSATTPYASHSDSYAQRYTDNNLSFVNTGQENVLRIQSRKETATSGTQTWNYTSGTITTGSRVDYGGQVKKSFGYGYYEMRAKLPKGQGIWPSFWLTNDDPDPAKHQEIDVFEVLGHEPNKVYMTYHRSGQQVYQSAYVGPDFSAAFHTFAVDWQPGYIRWYIDGVKRGEYTGLQFSNQLWIVADTMVGTPGSWSGAPDATTVFPQNYDIDYIRGYSALPTAVTPPPADTVAPTVAITAPTTGAVISGTVNVDANASDNVGVSKVEVYVDGVLKGTKTSSPYTYPLDTTKLTAGNHMILAKAYDTSSLTSQSQVSVTVSSSTSISLPTIKITSPLTGVTLFNGRVAFMVNAVCPVQITGVDYYIDDKLVSTQTYPPFTYSVQTKKISTGQHTVKAILKDILNRTATDQITITKN